MKSQRTEVRNWDGSIITRPKEVVRPRSVDELKIIVQDEKRFPSPLRPIGAYHSPTRCGVADGGTLVDMRRINRIIEIGPEFVRVQAGAQLIDVARELAKQGLQLHVNSELGNMTMGSAACGGTRDASLPGQYGQLSSYVSAMKVVTPTGRILKVTDSQPDLLRLMRSSYGLLGIVYEATFKVRPLGVLSLRYETFDFESFSEVLPLLGERGEAMKFYMSPFRNLVTVEFRRDLNGANPTKTALCNMRNWCARTLSPAFGSVATTIIPVKPVRYYCIDAFNQAMQAGFVRAVSGANTAPTTHIMKYPKKSGLRRVSYSTWAFPESDYPGILGDYIDFCAAYYRDNGYRCNLPTVGYRIGQDLNSVFSYSSESPVLTLEPMSTGDKGWEDFLIDFNDFCSSRGGTPLFNETRGITRAQARRAFGERLRSFNGLRERVDPDNRFLNAYFMQLLA